MHQHYEDILSRIPEPPQWFDDYGVPRYCKFKPNRLANIYSTECALAEISCQQCGHRFLVAITPERVRDLLKASSERPQRKLADLILRGEIHYGDPPNIRCCAG